MREEKMDESDTVVGSRQSAVGRKTLPTARPTRRRFVRVVAAAAGVPLVIAAVRAPAPKPRLHSWRGEVLGALSELSLWHPDAAFARRTIVRVRHEIDRFERMFSLYR